MKKYYLLLFLVTASFMVNSQEMPIDFSDNADVFTAFDGSSFGKRANPDDTNDTVAEFFNNGLNPWQGFLIDLASPIDLDTEDVITLNFYQFDPNAHTIMVKLERGGSNPDIEVVVNINAGNGNSWNNGIQFDFSNAQISGSGSTIVGSGQYDRLVIFIDGGVNTTGTYLIDDINDGSEATDPNELDIVYTDLVWSDEFDTNGAVDDTKWHHQTFGPQGGGWFNGEVQHYTDRLDNSYVEGGFLHIVAKRETLMLNGVSRDFTSARLNSKFAFTYGRVDVRAKLPLGDGTWPAIWTLGKNISEPGAWFETQGYGTTPWPQCGELDVMEHGLHATNVVSSAIHTPSSHGNTVNTATKPLSDVANTFHVYSMNWSPNQVTFLIDDVAYYTYKPSVQDNNTWPFDLDQYLLLNVAMGGFAGNVDPSFTESDMVIDYVRVYQNTTASTENVFADQFTVYPNPSDASGIIRIQTTENIDAVELYNYLGQLIQRKVSDTLKLDVSEISSGLYFMKIYSGNRVVTKKALVK